MKFLELKTKKIIKTNEYVENNTYLVSVEWRKVFIHLINGIPLCKEKEENGKK